MCVYVSLGWNATAACQQPGCLARLITCNEPAELYKGLAKGIGQPPWVVRDLPYKDAPIYAGGQSPKAEGMLLFTAFL